MKEVELDFRISNVTLISLYTSLYGLHLRMWEYCPYSDMWLQRAEGSHVLDKNDLVIIVNLEYIKLITKIKIK